MLTEALKDYLWSEAYSAWWRGQPGHHDAPAYNNYSFANFKDDDEAAPRTACGITCEKEYQMYGLKATKFLTSESYV